MGFLSRITCNKSLFFGSSAANLWPVALRPQVALGLSLSELVIYIALNFKEARKKCYRNSPLKKSHIDLEKIWHYLLHQYKQFINQKMSILIRDKASKLLFQ